MQRTGQSLRSDMFAKGPELLLICMKRLTFRVNDRPAATLPELPVWGSSQATSFAT